MIIYNIKDKYNSIVRKDSHIFLYKLISTNTEKKEINGIIEDVVNDYNYEYIIIPRTSDTETYFLGEKLYDPILENFEDYLIKGRILENNLLREKKIQEAREKRWNTVGNTVFDNGTFSNLASERNANMLYQSIVRYKEYKKHVNWLNLNGKYVEVNNENLVLLESLYNDISDFTQDTFDVLINIIKEINSIEIANEIIGFDIEEAWIRNSKSAF